MAEARLSGVAAGTRSLLQDATASPGSVLKVIVWVVDMCGRGGGPSTTAAALRPVMVGPGQTNLVDYMSFCSTGLTTIDAASFTTLDARIACSGVSADGTTWSVDQCTGDDILGWFDNVEQQTAATGVDLLTYTHRIMVLPNNQANWMGAACGWAGLSSQGTRNGIGYTWISGGAWNWLPAYLHELGHTFDLQHAATPATPSAPACPTCDITSAMAYYGAAGTQCYNAPQNWALGWTQEVSPGLSFQNMTPGQAQTFTVPGQDMGPRAVLRVQGGSANNAQVFVSVRSNTGLYDTPFTDSLPRILIHVWDANAQLHNIANAGQTYLYATLVQGGSQAWTDATTGLVVRAVQVDPSGASASVSVCRPTPGQQAKELFCDNGLDDDCNGLTDSDDPNCQPGPLVTLPALGIAKFQQIGHSAATTGWQR